MLTFLLVLAVVFAVAGARGAWRFVAFAGSTVLVCFAALALLLFVAA